jgi:hypothetical protein
VTGWQSNNGGQGDWNQPSFGPDPQTNQYGTDPYASPYGTNPYPVGPSGAEPYAQGYDAYQQYPPSGGFPAQQQYPPTGGFPAQGYGPPPPPPPQKRSKLPMILSLVAIVIIIGAVVTIVLVNRQDSQPVAQKDPSSTSSTSSQESSQESTPKSSSSPTDEPSGPDGWVTIDNSAAGLTYQVPPDWEPREAERQTGKEGITFSGNANYGVYDCEGSSYVRTFAASGSVQGKNGASLDLPATLDDFAKSFATTYFGADAQVDVPAPTEANVEGQTAMTVTAKVTQNVTKPACQAKTGEVGLIGILLESDGKPTGVAMLVVVNDIDGGPAEPKPLDASITQQVLQTVRVG